VCYLTLLDTMVPFKVQSTVGRAKKVESPKREEITVDETSPEVAENATAKYTRYTFWVAIFTAVAAAGAAVSALITAHGH